MKLIFDLYFFIRTHIYEMWMNLLKLIHSRKKGKKRKTKGKFIEI
ncbi:hypothetical protein CBUD_0378b [Coxiella burnetii Dugway 5J108-111]|uniref:Uncharacterized protein n=1 Tax=Coxiella burnetii (strain Dugway 5J108-111) TaxID=434922 RepID=B5XHR5_COXBN|nr:hypothetical protein CBUD_0378b [Coxiella burnetii Dugway 5J108-111]